MKTKCLGIALIALFFSAGCSGMSISVEEPVDAVATQVAATVSAIEAAAAPTATIAPVPTDATVPTNAPAAEVGSGEVYVDPDFGFQVRYDPSWTFQATEGTELSILDGVGRTLRFDKKGYQLDITVLGGIADPGCGGLFGPDFSLDDYHMFSIDGTEVWRIRAEDGLVNGFYMDDLSFVEIISPEVVLETPDEDGYQGQYICRFVISDHLVAITYRLPLSVDLLQAGAADRAILDEMDQIMTSLTWKP